MRFVKCKLDDLHFHHTIARPGQKAAKAANGGIAQIIIAQHVTQLDTRSRGLQPDSSALASDTEKYAPTSWMLAVLIQVFSISLTARLLDASNTSRAPGKACAMQEQLLADCPLYQDMWQAHIGAKNWAVSSAKKEA